GRGKPQWLLMKMKDEFATTEDGSAEREVKPKSRHAAKKVSRSHARPSDTAREEVAVTHPDRVLFPDAGLTKEDVFAYYRKVADQLLPFLKDRPVTLERLPEGLAEGAPHFWQKNTPSYYPDWIPRIRLETEQGKPVEYVLVNDEQALLYL